MLWRSRIISVGPNLGVNRGTSSAWGNEYLNERMKQRKLKCRPKSSSNAQIWSLLIGQNPSWWFGWDRFKRSSSCFVILKNARYWMVCRHVGQNLVVFLTSWVTMRRENVENEAMFLVRMIWPWPGFSWVLSVVFFCSALTCTVACRDRLLYCLRVFSFRFFFCNVIG